ncbi:hypothetical protein [Mesorhizobium sp. WSM3862]|uniref:hypothetical protein n=1 Tax=Mesorhizobium sp. WSM3862 TaxID=632858 RepID=UPI001FE086BC|nr:hypothetical protein [Mesorhizobium sp. WSM3862]
MLDAAHEKAQQVIQGPFGHSDDISGTRRRNRGQLPAHLPRVERKTVCPPLSVRWLALHCASEGCSGGPSRSSSQEDEPWQIIGKHLSESMSRS